MFVNYANYKTITRGHLFQRATNIKQKQLGKYAVGHRFKTNLVDIWWPLDQTGFQIYFVLKEKISTLRLIQS